MLKINIRSRRISGFGVLHFGFFLVAIVALLSIAIAPLSYAEKSTTGYGYTRAFGGTGADTVSAVDTDPQGNAYIVGTFTGTVDFDPGTGVNSRSSNGGADVYLSKFLANGDYVYTKTFGGSGTEGLATTGLAVTSQHEIYIAGTFSTTVDFDPGVGAVSRTSAGGADGYISRFDTDGNLVFNKTFGGTGAEQNIGVTVPTDKTSDVYVFGGYSNTVDFDPSVSTSNFTAVGARNPFMSKFDNNGNYVRTNVLPGPDSAGARVATSPDGKDVYMFDSFSTDIDLNPAATGGEYTSQGGTDVYLIKFDENGIFKYGKSYGGAGSENSRAAVAPNGDLYVSGVFSGTVDFDPSPGTSTLTSNGGIDAYVSKFEADGTYVWTRVIGGVDDEGINKPIITAHGKEVYISGVMRGTVDFDPGSGVANRVSNGDADAYLAAYTTDGAYVSATTFGGSGAESGASIAFGVDSIYIAGFFNTTVDFDTGAGVDPRTSAGGNDAFISKYSMTFTQNALAPAGFTAINTSNNQDLGLGGSGVPRGTITTARLVTASGQLPLAEMSFEFSADLDWSNVTGTVADAEYKSVVTGITNAPHTLFVPKRLADDRVVVCPNAQTIADVTLYCTNARSLSLDSSDVRVVTVNGKSYWAIANISGAGAMSTSQQILSSSATVGVPNTGVGSGGNWALIFTAYVGAILTGTAIVLSIRKYISAS